MPAAHLHDLKTLWLSDGAYRHDETDQDLLLLSATDKLRSGPADAYDIAFARSSCTVLKLHDDGNQLRCVLLRPMVAGPSYLIFGTRSVLEDFALEFTDG